MPNSQSYLQCLMSNALSVCVCKMPASATTKILRVPGREDEEEEEENRQLKCKRHKAHTHRHTAQLPESEWGMGTAKYEEKCVDSYIPPDKRRVQLMKCVCVCGERVTKRGGLSLLSSCLHL